MCSFPHQHIPLVLKHMSEQYNMQQLANWNLLTCVCPVFLRNAGDPAILQQAAATQLLMAQAPVPGEMLLGKGVLEHLLDVTTQLVPCCMSPESDKCLQAPASCIDMDTGELVADVYDKVGDASEIIMAFLLTCAQLASLLLLRCVVHLSQVFKYAQADCVVPFATMTRYGQ
jgi:hypothetical protein